MCGIAGIITTNKKPVAEQDLRTMAAALVHRGPDDEGIATNGHVGFAFRRLSIIDLSTAGHQPMATEDGRYTIVFNGEIYNYRQLSATLRAKGHVFHSKTDTEVLLHAYAEWGGHCLDRLNGMYAFAIYDRERDVIFCARDPLGIKPLYYFRNGARIVFASEIKAILALRGVRRALDPAALHEYFTFQNIFSDRTLFDGIRIVPPGHTLIITQKTVSLRRYWDPVFSDHGSMKKNHAVDELRSIFEAAVTRHLIGDVPVGSQLSGGMDSASIAAVSVRSIPQLMTFTAGFDVALATGLEMNFDERKDAEIVARHVGSQQYQMVIQPGDMERILPDLIWHLEDLRLGNSYPNYYMCELARKFVKVALSGAGGDELFAGYPWRYEVVAGATNPGEFDRRYFDYWSRLIKTDDRPSFFQPAIWRSMQTSNPYDAYRSVIAEVDHLTPINKALYFELKTFLHGLLIVEDKVSSAHGLEVRVPFLDRQLVEFALRLPSSWKVKNGVGKAILREALAPYLPKEILTKKKQGFAAPEGSWFRQQSLAYIRDMLLSPRSRIHEFVRPAAIERVLRQHVGERLNHRLLIWSLLSFEWWIRLFLDGEYQKRSP